MNVNNKQDHFDKWDNGISGTSDLTVSNTPMSQDFKRKEIRQKGQRFKVLQ